MWWCIDRDVLKAVQPAKIITYGKQKNRLLLHLSVLHRLILLENLEL